MTAEERKMAFLKEFYELLNKHGAEFEVTVDDSTYGYGGVAIANITMMGQWDDNNERIHEYVDFDLPTLILTAEK